MNLDAQAIRHKAHHAGDSTQGICSSCCLRWASGTKKMLRPMSPPITSMIWAWATVLGAGDFDLVARIDAKAPRVLSVTVKAQAESGQNCQSDQRHADPKQAIGGLLGERSAADGNALLPAQEWGFLLRFQIAEPSVVERLALGSLAFDASRGSGYSSSWTAVELDFRATIWSQLSTENR